MTNKTQQTKKPKEKKVAPKTKAYVPALHPFNMPELAMLGRCVDAVVDHVSQQIPHYLRSAYYDRVLVQCGKFLSHLISNYAAGVEIKISSALSRKEYPFIFGGSTTTLAGRRVRPSKNREKIGGDVLRIPRMLESFSAQSVLDIVPLQYKDFQTVRLTPVFITLLGAMDSLTKKSGTERKSKKGTEQTSEYMTLPEYLETKTYEGHKLYDLGLLTRSHRDVKKPKYHEYPTAMFLPHYKDRKRVSIYNQQIKEGNALSKKMHGDLEPLRINTSRIEEGMLAVAANKRVDLDFLQNLGGLSLDPKNPAVVLAGDPASPWQSMVQLYDKNKVKHGKTNDHLRAQQDLSLGVFRRIMHLRACLADILAPVKTLYLRDSLDETGKPKTIKCPRAVRVSDTEADIYQVYETKALGGRSYLVQSSGFQVINTIVKQAMTHDKEGKPFVKGCLNLDIVSCHFVLFNMMLEKYELSDMCPIVAQKEDLSALTKRFWKRHTKTNEMQVPGVSWENPHFDKELDAGQKKDILKILFYATLNNCGRKLVPSASSKVLSGLTSFYMPFANNHVDASTAAKFTIAVWNRLAQKLGLFNAVISLADAMLRDPDVSLLMEIPPKELEALAGLEQSRAESRRERQVFRENKRRKREAKKKGEKEYEEDKVENHALKIRPIPTHAVLIRSAVGYPYEIYVRKEGDSIKAVAPGQMKKLMSHMITGLETRHIHEFLDANRGKIKVQAFEHDGLYIRMLEGVTQDDLTLDFDKIKFRPKPFSKKI